MTIFDIWLDTDLQKPLQVALLPGVFFAGDDQANRINVRVTSGGEAAPLSGTVTAYAIRSDESTLIMTGALSSSTASVLLPEAAYAMPGPLDIVIKLISGDQRTAVGACRAYVARTSTDAIVDPGHVIPSLEELLALIERMEQDMALIEGMTAAAHGLDTLQPPTVTVTREDGHFHLDFGIPKGATGDGGVSSVNGYAPDSQGNVTIPNATAAADGLLSAGDKDKLSNLSFPLPVNKGGTGRDFFTYGEVLMGNNAGRLLTKPITDISQDGDIGATLNLVNARTLVHYANYRLGDYLPLTGGTLTGDLIIDAHSLVINGAWYPHMQLKATQDGSTNEGRVEASHYGRLSLQSWNDETGDDRRILDILNSSTGAPLAESLILRETVDGNNGTEYRVITSAGGTVNGALEFTTPAGSGAEILTFSQSAGFTELAICKSDDGTTRKRFAFRQYRPSGTYSETYVLPSTTNDITASANYDILTSKSAVTVPQGGTGATSFASGAALIGNGDEPVTTRAITNLTSDGTVTANTNLITANTLVHYANNRLGSYLPLSGGTLSGALTLSAGNIAIQKGSLTVGGDANYRGVNIYGASGSPNLHLRNTGARLTIDQYPQGSTGGERFLMPTPQVRSADAWYDILTTKHYTIAKAAAGNIYIRRAEDNGTAIQALIGADRIGFQTYDGSAWTNAMYIDPRIQTYCCQVGQSGSSTTDPWYKVATTTMGTNDDAIVDFLVEDTYGNHFYGILRAHVRTGGSATYGAGTLQWLAKVGYDDSDFVLVVPTGANPTVELWTRVAQAYVARRFTTLAQGNRTTSYNRWTLLNAYTAGQAASITTAGTQIVSVVGGKYATGSSPSTVSGSFKITAPANNGLVGVVSYEGGAYKIGVESTTSPETFQRYEILTDMHPVLVSQGGTGCDNAGTTTTVNGGTISVANNTITSLGSITLDPGVYMIQVIGHFASNATGYRQIVLANSATGSNMDRYCMSRTGAASGVDTDLSFTVCRGLTSRATYYANARQTSGSALDCYCGIRATKIAAN